MLIYTLHLQFLGQPEGRNRSKSTEKSKTDKPSVRRKRQTIDTADLASIANSLEKAVGEDLNPIKSEPVSTQTEYTEKKVIKVNNSLVQP